MTGRDALIFFYGLFWATSVASASRYRPFATHVFWDPDRRSHALKRFAWAFLLVNVGPIASVAFLHSFVVPDERGFWAVASAGLASISVFGFVRLLHGVIASESTHTAYYADHEWARMTTDWLTDEPNAFWAHVLPGLVYVLVIPGLAALLGRLSS